MIAFARKLAYFLIFGFSACAASADTKTCNDVDNRAEATAFDTITWYGDRTTKVCSFTIGGATKITAHPEAVKLLAGVRRDLADFNKRRDLLSRSSTGDHYVISLLGAATATGFLPDEALSKMKSSRQIRRILDACYKAVSSGEVMNEKSESEDFRCGLTRAPYFNEPKLYLFASLRIATEKSNQEWGTSIPLP